VDEFGNPQSSVFVQPFARASTRRKHLPGKSVRTDSENRFPDVKHRSRQRADVHFIVRKGRICLGESNPMVCVDSSMNVGHIRLAAAALTPSDFARSSSKVLDIANAITLALGIGGKLQRPKIGGLA
jgi:hypothetical protein